MENTQENMHADIEAEWVKAIGQNALWFKMAKGNKNKEKVENYCVKTVFGN